MTRVRYLLFSLFFLLFSAATVSAGDRRPGFRFTLWQEAVYSRATGSRGETGLDADLSLPFGMVILAGYTVDTASGRLSGYHAGASSPVFLRWFRAEARVVDRVYPAYGMGTLGYLLLFRCEGREPDRDKRNAVFRFAGRAGPLFHFERTADKGVYSPVPVGFDYTILTLAYDLGVVFYCPVGQGDLWLDLTAGVRNLSRHEACFVADFSLYLRGNLFAERLTLLVEAGASPAGNFFLSGTWHSLFFSVGVSVCL